MESKQPLSVPLREHIPYIFIASLAICQLAWEFKISKNPECLLSIVLTVIYQLFTMHMIVAKGSASLPQILGNVVVLLVVFIPI